MFKMVNTFSSLFSISSLIFLSSVFLSSTAQELLNPTNERGEIFVHPSKLHQHYIPVLFTGPFNRRSIPLTAGIVTSHEEQQQPASSSFIDEDPKNGNSDGYVVQKLFSSNTNSNNNLQQQQRNNGAPLYPVVFSRKPNKVWAPHNLRVEHHQSFGNAMKQILMRMNYQV